mmetsp:Transcript_15191/g.38615  ORF Transcript_15191/g.38615 Transcript_15191/m.38615 type:complete len:274 (-) Transcript_15191:1506-2327(-)
MQRRRRLLRCRGLQGREWQQADPSGMRGPRVLHGPGGEARYPARLRRHHHRRDVHCLGERLVRVYGGGWRPDHADLWRGGVAGRDCPERATADLPHADLCHRRLQLLLGPRGRRHMLGLLLRRILRVLRAVLVRRLHGHRRGRGGELHRQSPSPRPRPRRRDCGGGGLGGGSLEANVGGALLQRLDERGLDEHGDLFGLRRQGLWRHVHRLLCRWVHPRRGSVGVHMRLKRPLHGPRSPDLHRQRVHKRLSLWPRRPERLLWHHHWRRVSGPL